MRLSHENSPRPSPTDPPRSADGHVELDKRSSPKADRASLTIERRAALALAGVIVMLVAGGIVTYGISAEFMRSAESVAYTQEARARIGHLHASVADAESALRTYGLSGGVGHRDMYRTFANDAGIRASELAVFVTDPAQRDRAARLKALVDRRLANLHLAMLVYDRRGGVRQDTLELIEAGTALMTQVRALSDEIDLGETRLLELRRSHADEIRQAAVSIFVALLLGAALVYVVMLRGIRREMLARHEAV